MKKTLIIILALIISINLFGCTDQELKLKVEYENQIGEGLAGALIEMTKDVIEIYQTATDDFEIRDVEEELYSYGWDVYYAYLKYEGPTSDVRKELLDVMQGLYFDSYALYSLKEEYRDNPQYTQKEYKEQLDEIKGHIENALEDAKKFVE